MLRPLRGIFEQYYYSSIEFPPQMQVCIKLKENKDVEKVKENFRKIFFGLRTKCDGKAYYKREGPEFISKLPDYISKCEDAANYILLNSPPHTEALASMMYNDNIVVVNTHHTLCDGEYAAQSVKHCLDDEIKDPVEYPLSLTEAYGSQIKYVREHMPTDVYPNSACTLAKCKGKDEPQTNGPNFILSDFDINKLQCFDTKLNKPVGLTDALWTSTSLAICTLENDFSKFCVNTCYNMRSLFKNWENKWNYCDQFTVPNVNAKKHTMDMTIRELGAEFRKHFEYLKKDCNMLYPLNYPYDYTYPKGVYMNISNLGPQELDDRIDDIYMQATHEGPGMETFIYYFTYSKVSKNKNTFHSRMRFPREAITSKKAHIISDSINHLLVDVPLDTTLAEATSELHDFQEKLEKVYKNI